eukprot:13432864-Ditylum_brightwellii.AAC.1
MWTKIKSILVEWGQLNTAIPDLMRALLEGISGWHTGDDEGMAGNRPFDKMCQEGFFHQVTTVDEHWR